MNAATTIRWIVNKKQLLSEFNYRVQVDSLNTLCAECHFFTQRHTECHSCVSSCVQRGLNAHQKQSTNCKLVLYIRSRVLPSRAAADFACALLAVRIESLASALNSFDDPNLRSVYHCRGRRKRHRDAHRMRAHSRRGGRERAHNPNRWLTHWSCVEWVEGYGKRAVSSNMRLRENTAVRGI